jgi:8-oxo-dGTP pyrophosphatase MutT (NUDIX family)
VSRYDLRQKLYLFLVRHKRAMTIGVRAAVFDDAGRVLLLKHSYTPGWHFPGGGVEPGETLVQSVGRELDEEAGVALTGEPGLFGVYLNRIHSHRDHVAVFVCREWKQARTVKIPNFEIVDCRFFAREDLQEDTTAGTRRRLAEILDGAPQSADW